MDESLSPQPDVDLSEEDRRRMFQERYAQALSNIRANAGPLSVAAVPFPTGPQAQLSIQNPFVTPFVNVDPFSQEPVQSYGARTGNMGPAGGYELAYTYDPQTKVPVVSGAYRKQLDKDSEITAQGSYVPLPGRDAYQAMMQYKQRFADGGEVFAEGEAPYEQELTDYIKQELSSFRNIPPNVLETMAAEREETRTPAYRKPSELSAYMSAVVPGLKVQREKMPIGALGEVSSAVPDTMKVKRTLTGGLSEATQLHEMEHVLKNRAMQGAPKSEKIDNDVRFDRLYGDESGKTRREMVDAFIKNKAQIEKFFGRRLDDYFNAETKKEAGRNFGAMFEEQIATISALEQITGKSITKGMPDLFPNDKAAAVYDAITGLRQTRLDAKDLPPYTPQYKSGMDWIKKKLRMRADGSPPEGEVATQMIVGTPLTEQEQAQPSIARQALDAVIGAGKQVKENITEAVTSPATFHKRALGNIAKRLEEDPEGFVMDWTGGGLGGIIRPKGGGNLLKGEVERTIEPLRPTVTMPDNLGKPQTLPPSEVRESLKDLISRSKSAGYPTEYAENLLKDVEPMAALDDWIKNKLGGYIKKQMGTEDDPVRKLADEMTEKAQAEYQAGLKRIAKMKEDIAKAQARGKRTTVSEQELADEIERVEEAFKNASILPVQLPPYTHVSASLGEAREKAGFSPYEIAKSREGKSYEEMADVPFIPKTVEEIKKNVETMRTMGPGWAQTSEDVLEKNPWILKLKDEDLVYRIRDYDINEKQIFTHTIDELRNALNPNSGLPQNLLLKPEDMQSLGIEKAFRHVNNINDWRAQQRIAANLEEAKRSAVTIKEYPDTPKRLQWQQLKPMEYTELPPGYRLEPRTIRPTQPDAREGSDLYGPDGEFITTFIGEGDSLERALKFVAKNDLEKALQYEGSTMRHCVGGYCDSVWTGETNIFSLRDKKGEPHVTIETAPPDIRRDGNTPRDFLDSLNFTGESYRAFLNRYGLRQDEVDDIFYKNDPLNTINANRKIIASPEFQEWLRNKPSEILQIKGKGNGKPAEQYMPFIQDFIKSQQWSHIGDLQNTNLVPLKPGLLKNAQDRGFTVDVIIEQNGQPYITKEEFNRLAGLFGGMNKYD